MTVSTIIAYYDSGQIVVDTIPFPAEPAGMDKVLALINSDEVAKIEIVPAQEFANK